MATEAFRKQVSRQLTELQDGVGPESIEFPHTLSSEERKYVHSLCHQFGLASKSRGNGANRYLTVRQKQGGGGGGKGGPAGKGNGKGGASGGAAGGSAAPAALHHSGVPFRLPAGLAKHPMISKLPSCPEAWSLTAAADPRHLGGGKAAGKGKPPARAELPTRSALDATEAARRKRPAYAPLQASRRKLPAWSFVDEVIGALAEHQVVLVAGETGCGKSTQIPQYMMDSMPSSKMIVTQPRRIAAVSLAQRVAQERTEEVGRTVGYAIHMERKSSQETRCTFCTTGVFRRRLLSDPQLTGLTHVVVDEVHERELHGDFVLIVLKQLLERRKDLRLVLMSATLQLKVFQDFFPGCATVEIPGRTFPVHHLYLEEVVTTLHKNPRFRPFLGPAFAAAGNEPDEKAFKRQVATQERHADQVCGYGWALQQPMTKERLADGCYKHDVLQQGKGTTFDVAILDALILHLNKEHEQKQKTSPGAQAGAILVFLPGWGDIDQAKRRLRESLDHNLFWVLPCHSQVRPEQQREIFKKPPPGVRKIILASNIAETSITIEDVSVVIDTGRAKETSYDPYLKVGTLATVFVSKASAAQRAGRAGRTKEGVCYHLFSKERHKEMEQFRAPELLRSPLEDVCLHTAHLLAQQRVAAPSAGRSRVGGMGISEWLAQAPQPPDAVAVKNAAELLKVLGALTPEGEISRLGVKLANLPLPATLARSVVWGALLGCLDPILTIVGSSSGRDPFQLPSEPGGGNRLGNRGSSFGYLSGLLRQKKRGLTHPVQSDHYALLRATQEYEEARAAGGEGAARRVCEEFSLNARAVQNVIDVRNKMKNELRTQKLLSDELMSFVNRNSDNTALILAVVAAGVYPNLAVKRPTKKKIEVNGGRVDAGSHPQSVLDTGGKDKGGGKGKDGGGKASNSGQTEWLCYTEMTQVEERYSMTGLSRVAPSTLLLLCGDEPLEIHGSGPDVLVRFLGGWVEFAMPREQATKMQNLRYALRHAFLDYCEAPLQHQKHRSALDCAATLLKASMDASGLPSAGDAAYRPPGIAGVPPPGRPAAASAAAPAPGALTRPVGGATPSSATAKASARLLPASSKASSPAAPSSRQTPRQGAGSGSAAVPPLAEGQELGGIQDLVKDLYGQAPAGQKPIAWTYKAKDGQFMATLQVTFDSSEYSGDWAPSQKQAQRDAARSAWAALHQGSAESLEEGEEDADMAGLDAELEGEDAELEDALIELDEDPYSVGEVGEVDAGVEEEVYVDDEDAPEAEAEAAEEVFEGEGVEDTTGDAAEELLLDVDDSSAAAMRFMMGDTSYLEAAEGMDDDLDEVADAPAKRQRLG